METNPEYWPSELESDPVLWCIQTCIYYRYSTRNSPTSTLKSTFRFAVSLGRSSWTRWPTNFIPGDGISYLGPLITYITQVHRSQDYTIMDEVLIIVSTIAWDNVDLDIRDRHLLIKCLIPCLAKERPPNLRHSALRAVHRLRYWLVYISPAERRQFSKNLYEAIYFGLEDSEKQSTVSLIDDDFFRAFSWIPQATEGMLWVHYFQILSCLRSYPDWAYQLISERHIELSLDMMDRIYLSQPSFFDQVTNVLSPVQMIMMVRSADNDTPAQLESSWRQTIQCWKIIQYMLVFRADDIPYNSRQNHEIFTYAIEPLMTFTMAKLSKCQGISDLSTLKSVLTEILGNIRWRMDQTRHALLLDTERINTSIIKLNELYKMVDDFWIGLDSTFMVEH